MLNYFFKNYIEYFYNIYKKIWKKSKIIDFCISRIKQNMTSEVKSLDSDEKKSSLSSEKINASTFFNKKICFECIDGKVVTLMNEELIKYSVLRTFLVTRIGKDETDKDEVPTFFLNFSQQDVTYWIYHANKRKSGISCPNLKVRVDESIHQIDEYLQKDVDEDKRVAEEFYVSLKDKLFKFASNVFMKGRLFDVGTVCNIALTTDLLNEVNICRSFNKEWKLNIDEEYHNTIPKTFYKLKIFVDSTFVYYSLFII